MGYFRGGQKWPQPANKKSKTDIYIACQIYVSVFIYLYNYIYIYIYNFNDIQGILCYVLKYLIPNVWHFGEYEKQNLPTTIGAWTR